MFLLDPSYAKLDLGQIKVKVKITKLTKKHVCANNFMMVKGCSTLNIISVMISYLLFNIAS